MAETKAAAKSDARGAAREKVRKAQQASADALKAQHDAKVELQNARFKELGESMNVKNSLGELGVTVKD